MVTYCTKDATLIDMVYYINVQMHHPQKMLTNVHWMLNESRMHHHRHQNTLVLLNY